MAIARTGSVGVYNSGLTNSGNTTISVPADATFAIVCVSTYRNSAAYLSGGSVTLGGQSMSAGLIKESTAQMMGGIWYLVNPPTGDQSLAWDWSGTGNPAEDNMFHYAFYNGVDTSSPVRSSGGQQVASGTASTGVLTALSGDFIVAFGWVFESTGSTPIIGWTNATEVREDVSSVFDTNNHIAYAEASPSGDVTITRTITAGADGGIVAVIMVPAAGGGTIPHNPVGFPFYGPLGGPL